jgi:hypothetical protein
MHKTNVHENVWGTCFWCCNEESNVIHVHGFVFFVCDKIMILFFFLVLHSRCTIYPWLLLF